MIYVVTTRTLSSNIFIGTIAMPAEDASFPDGTVCRISGWGWSTFYPVNRPDVLQTTTVRIDNEAEYCRKYYPGDYITCVWGNDDSSACQGDSGGGLVGTFDIFAWRSMSLIAEISLKYPSHFFNTHLLK